MNLSQALSHQPAAKCSRHAYSAGWWDAQNFMLTVSIPANTTATIFIPAKSPDEVWEGGRPAATSPGVNFLQMENDCATFAVASGKHAFSASR